MKHDFAGTSGNPSRSETRGEAAEGLFGVLCQADLAAGVAAGGEQVAQLGVAGVAQAFVRGDQQPPRPIERVVFASVVARVSFWTGRCTSSMLLFAKRTTWNGSATWPT